MPIYMEIPDPQWIPISLHISGDCVALSWGLLWSWGGCIWLWLLGTLAPCTPLSWPLVPCALNHCQEGAVLGPGMW